MKKGLLVFYLGTLVALVIIGFTQYHSALSFRQQLEASYERAFLEFASHLNGIENELSKAQVASTAEKHMQIYSNIWRLVYASQANLGQLPVGEVSLQRIKTYLAELQNKTVQFFSQAVKEPQAFQKQTEINQQLKQLYEQAQYLNQEIQLALATRERGDSLLMTQALIAIEDGMSNRFFDSEFPGELDRLALPKIEGEQITSEDALRIAEEFLAELAPDYQLAVTNEAFGSLPTYTIVASKEGQPEISLEISKHGGYVLWLINPRNIPSQVLCIEEMVSIANDFLQVRNFPEVELVSTEIIQNKGHLVYAVVDQGVVIYPETLTVQVAGDRQEIVGFRGLAFYSVHKERELRPAITMTDAQAVILEPGNIQPEDIVQSRLAVIFNDSYQEVLVYEFRIHHAQEEFLVYINANEGTEEKIHRVQPGLIK
ncbi:MAG: hypothetical protein GX020_08665 [Firmicutes bacterium]|nr:hypothetical protein [Bacillota bacterium]